MPGNNEVTLDNMKIYTVEEIKNLAIAVYKTNLNEKYFESTIVQLGNKDYSPIDSFTNDNGEKGLWKYLKKTTDKAHRASIYLLTTNVSPRDALKPITDNARLEKQTDLNVKSKDKKDSCTIKSLCDLPDLLEIPVITPNPMSITKENSSVKSNVSKHKIDVQLLTKKKSDSFTLKNFPDCPALLYTPVRTSNPTSCTKESSRNLSDMSSAGSSFAKGKISYFKEPMAVKRKTLKLEDINDLKVPLVTEIPFSHLIIHDVILGKGSFGTVKRGVWSECDVAIKSMDTVYQEPKEIIKEVAILRQINHKNIVGIMGVSNTKTEFHIIMEFVDGYTLRDAIFKDAISDKLSLTMDDKYTIAMDICAGITFLRNHPLKVIHRDIKPANIMLTKAKIVKMCDLGLAKFNDLNSQLLSTRGKKLAPGTPLFMAPEIYLSYKEASEYTDVWSLGCTLLEFFSGNQLWKLNSCNSPCNLESLSRQRKIPWLQDVPECLEEMFQKCFDYNYMNRPSAKEMFETLKKIHSSL